MRNKWNQTLANLKRDIALIESSAKETTTQLEALRREVESFKLDFLMHRLEAKRKAAARSRGATALIRNQRMRRGGLLAAASGFILGGLMTGDPSAALGAGMSGFDGVLQGLGETRWAVSLGKRIVVTPQGSVPPSGTWVTYESLQVALAELREKALTGQELGDLDSLIAKLNRGRRKLIYLNLPRIRIVSSQEFDPD